MSLTDRLLISLTDGEAMRKMIIVSSIQHSVECFSKGKVKLCPFAWALVRGEERKVKGGGNRWKDDE